MCLRLGWRFVAILLFIRVGYGRSGEKATEKSIHT